MLVLEGMVVSIQTTRLVLFEFFTRFLPRRGRIFRPLPAPPSFPQEKLDESLDTSSSPRSRCCAGAISVVATMLLAAAPAALAAAPGAGDRHQHRSVELGLLGAALATGMSSLGAGFAVAKVGTAAIGALAEKPELFGRLLIFVGLAEGIAIYGLIVSILILNKLT